AARPNNMPASARQGTIANLSTVPTMNAGSSRYTCSSTNTTGTPSGWLLGQKGQVSRSQPTVTRVGFLRSSSVRLAATSFFPHQGQSSRGQGDGPDPFQNSPSSARTSAMVLLLALR